MDQVANKHWKKIQTILDPTMHHSLLGEPWELWLENEKVSTKAKHRLLDHTCGQAAQDYWANRTQFCRMDIQSIN